MKQYELQTEKREASAKLAQKMANVEARRQELQNQKTQKAGGRYSRAKEVSSATKAAKTQEHHSKVSQLQMQQKAANDRREPFSIVEHTEYDLDQAPLRLSPSTF